MFKDRKYQKMNDFIAPLHFSKSQSALCTGRKSFLSVYAFFAKQKGNFIGTVHHIWVLKAINNKEIIS